MYKGISVLASGCMPAHALYFAVYEAGKVYLNVGEDASHYEDNKFKFFHTMLIGAMATIGHDSIVTPSDMIKQRI
jgi:solute carrier family 25 iron transporter 28/37